MARRSWKRPAAGTCWSAASKWRATCRAISRWPTFFDVGNAFNRFGDPLEYSVGVGLRYRLPVVSLGLDMAQPLSTNDGPRLHLNISPKL